MSIKQKEHFDGYYIMPWEFGSGTVMVLTGPWQRSFRDILKVKEISALRLSDSAGWAEDNLSFISDLGFLKGIEIYRWEINDISPVQELVQLESIGIQCGAKKSIDFSKFRMLSDCYLAWRPQFESIFSCIALNSLNIENYPHTNFTPISNLINLKALKITSRKLESLLGLEALVKLSKLDLYNCQQLSALKGIENLKDLSNLEIDTCKKIYNIEPVGSLEVLENFKLDNCAKIKSLAPLKNCTKLKNVFFIDSTNVEDGDMSVFFKLPNLEKVVFANRRHYSNKQEDFK